MNAPLYGLLLAGGASTRMRRDKAALIYRDKPQLLNAFELLSTVCENTFASVRSDQTNDAIRGGLPQIVDRIEGRGPIAGIQAAQATYPNAVWLVVACDLPFLDRATLEYLITHRDPTKIATAFRSSHDGLPEPLCALYEPRSRTAIEAYIAADGKCPRKFLMGTDIRLLDQPNPNSLDNVNTAEEYAAALQGTRLTISVRYHAILREQARCNEESVTTTAATPAALYKELRNRHSFSLDHERLRAAINDEFADWHTRLKDGDQVVFIPPVAGG